VDERHLNFAEGYGFDFHSSEIFGNNFISPRSRRNTEKSSENKRRFAVISVPL
jgi:hypothetical protein